MEKRINVSDRSSEMDSIINSFKKNAGAPVPPSPPNFEKRNVSSSPVPPPQRSHNSPVAPPRYAVNLEDAPVRPPEEPVDIEILDSSDDRNAGVPQIDDMLTWMVKNGGSDLFLSANLIPSTKLHGKITPIPGFTPLSDREVEACAYSIINAKQRAIFEETKELDCSYSVPGVSRFRVNIARSKSSVFCVIRTIPFDIKPISALNLPISINNYAKLPRGLVLVTGPTGSGKSTTLAAIIDEINRTQSGHILTVEDPIEFVHTHNKCVVNQREVGEGGDTKSFNNALKAAMREAPDYILVGELRDYETISLAITMAETGHLVFGTLHTNSAPETISRIIDVFPADQQEQIKTQLAASLQAVVCQNLVRTADGNGRVAVVEIMNTTQSVKSKIKKGHLDSLVSDLQTGERYGMQTMDSNLLRLANEGVIDIETAVEKAHRPRDMMTEFGGEEAYNRILEAKQNERTPRRRTN